MTPVDVGFTPLPPPLGSNKSTVTNVLLVSVKIADVNLNRRGFVVFNNSANSCYVSWSSPCVASRCVRVIPTYSSWECYGPSVYAGAFYCIRNAGSGDVTVWEITA